MRIKPKTINSLSKILVIVATIVFIITGITAGTAVHYLNKVDTVKINYDNLGIDEDKDRELKNYGNIKNIAIFFIDGPNNENSNSDDIMIITIDEVHKKLKITSLIKDTYVKIDGHGEGRLSHAYKLGGPELALKTINQNFGLNITDFATVNFNDIAKLIDELGGMNIRITKEEVEHMPGIESRGTHHLDGKQALIYSRIRLEEDDEYKKPGRKKVVLQEILKKLYNVSASEYRTMACKILPLIKTNLTGFQLLVLAPEVMITSREFLQDKYPLYFASKSKKIDGVDYLVYDEDATKEQLRQWIFEDSRL